jgi:hypothetical protein
MTGLAGWVWRLPPLIEKIPILKYFAIFAALREKTVSNYKV